MDGLNKSAKNANFDKNDAKTCTNFALYSNYVQFEDITTSHEKATLTDETKSNKQNKINKKRPSIFKRIFFVLLFIILSPVLLIYYIIKGIVKAVKKNKWEKEGKRGILLLMSSDISDIDIMEGYEFENYLKTLFFYEGYNSEVTSKAKDFGADLILEKDGKKIVVQAKRYNKTVGTKSVQEIIGGAKHYGAEEAMVVTNSHFTSSAETIAKENNIRLVDRDELIEIYTRVKKKLQLCTKESDLLSKEDADIKERFPNMI